MMDDRGGNCDRYRYASVVETPRKGLFSYIMWYNTWFVIQAATFGTRCVFLFVLAEEIDSFVTNITHECTRQSPFQRYSEDLAKRMNSNAMGRGEK